MLKTIQLLGVTITNESEKKVSEYVLEAVNKGTEKLFITTPNPEILVYANSHLGYRDKLNSCEVALPDGAGLLVAASILGKPLSNRITGVDFMERLCKDSKEKPVSMGFLGGRGGVAEMAALRLKEKYPWIKVSFVGEEWDSARGPVSGFPPVSAPPIQSELRAVGNPSSRATPALDILFVAFGAPKQEEWIYDNLPHLPVKAAMGVGGAFDYLSGQVPRAPLLLRSLGLEWLFRLIVQPWRIRRQLSLFTFLGLVIKTRFKAR
jgi:N-acetylglucosaminyldiphosphoundecaprenol N-acetyl-beta-D-mannosaminyltransferase